MNKFVIKEFTNRCWCIAEVHKNGVKIADINRYYSVDKDWIFIYDAAGGHDNIKKGALIEKIYIGDSEFVMEHIRETK
jgi:hypothetical protein